MTGPDQTTLSIGELCVGGDRACASGDLTALAEIAASLAVRAHEPLHCELVALAELCRCEPSRAVATWTELKEVLFEVGRRSRS